MPEPGNKALKLFASQKDLDTPEIALVNGELPKWLKGDFIRTGPGLWDFQGFSMNHMMDGYAVLSKFSINSDEVKFSKKMLQSDAYKRAAKANRPVITELATAKQPDPNKGLLGKLLSAVMPIELSDNSNVAVFQMGKDLLATSETCYFTKINQKLAAEEKFDTNKCYGTNIACAHPLVDSSTGSMYNIGLTVITGTKYNIVRIPNATSNQSAKDLMKKSQIICSIPSRWTGLMSYNHSFAMTKNYLIFIEQPFVMNIAKAAVTYLKNPPFMDWLEWRPDLGGNRFHVIEKATGKLIKTEFLSQDPFFFLHHMNAYEDNGQIVLDINSFESPDFLKSMYLGKLRSGDLSMASKARCHRYIIPVVSSVKDVPEFVDLVAVKSEAKAVRHGSTITLTPEVMSEEGFELPTINEKFRGLKYSYFYGAGSCPGTPFSHSICKIDVRKRETLLWKESEHFFPSEPLFVANPEGVTEDDGILMSAVIDSRQDSSDFLLFLDAKTLEEVARVTFRAHIPQAVHGTFITS